MDVCEYAEDQCRQNRSDFIGSQLLDKLYPYLDETVTLGLADIIHVKRARNLGFQMDANQKDDIHFVLSMLHLLYCHETYYDSLPVS